MNQMLNLRDSYVRTLASKSGKGGKTLARKHKAVGIVIGAWMVLSDGPTAAAAEFFDITPSGMEALLEGQARIDFEIWDPEGSADIAELRSGQVIKEGDAYYWAASGVNGLVGHVETEGGLLLKRNVNTDGYEIWNFSTSAWEAVDKATVISWLQ